MGDFVLPFPELRWGTDDDEGIPARLLRPGMENHRIGGEEIDGRFGNGIDIGQFGGMVFGVMADHELVEPEDGNGDHNGSYGKKV